MTPESLRAIRKSRGLTREKLALELGCSAQAIVHWEGGTRSIPGWVEEKIMSTTELKFPMKDLQEMMKLALEENMDFEELLSLSIQTVLEMRRNKKKDGKFTHLKEHLSSNPGESKVAEEPPNYG